MFDEYTNIVNHLSQVAETHFFGHMVKIDLMELLSLPNKLMGLPSVSKMSWSNHKIGEPSSHTSWSLEPDVLEIRKVPW